MHLLLLLLCFISTQHVAVSRTEFPSSSFLMAMGADVGFDAIHAKTQQHHKVVKGGPVTAESIANTTEGLIIIGAGPAGLSAAIYGSRANLRPLVISHDAGQLSTTGTVENFPSCTWNASGSDIMTSFREQADQFGARFLSARVQSVDLRSLPYRLTLGSGVSLNFKALIVASGLVPCFMPKTATFSQHKSTITFN